MVRHRDLNNNVVGNLGLQRRVTASGGALGHQEMDLWNQDDPGHVVWRRSGPVERLPSGMWRRLRGRLYKIVYPTM